MAYLPPVVARLSFDLGDLTEKIDEAKAKIHSLGDTIHIKTDIDNGTLQKIAQDTEAMHRIMGKNEAIRERVELDDADAKARLEALARTRTATIRVKVNKSDLDQAESFLGAIKKLLTGGPDINLPFTSMGASPAGLAAIGAAITALLPELSGLAGGFAAAGAGAGAFAALALPSIKSVTTAVSNLKAAQANVAKADILEKVAPSAAHLKALDEAKDKLAAAQKQLADMGPGATQAADGLQTLEQRFKDLAAGFKPQALKIFNDGLKIANDLLPTLGPMATAFANALDPLLKRLDKFVQSKGFTKWMDDFTSRIGPAVTAIGNGLAKAGPALGKFLTALSSPGSVNAINIAFGILTGTINGLTATVKFLASAWDGMKLAIDNVKASLHSVASAFDSVRHFIAGAGHDIAQDFDQARHAVASVAHSIASAFDTVRHDIAAKFDGVKAAIMGKFAGAASWLKGAAHDIANAFDHVRHDIATWFDGVKGAIASKFAGAGSWLISAGEAIMSGLLAGITSAWGKVASFLSGLKAKIQSLKGPLDQDRIMLYPHGQAIMQGLMAGMGSQVPALEAQLRGITHLIGGTGGIHPGAAGAAADQPIHVHVHLDGREITNAVAQRSVRTQNRTGTNQFTKRTR